MEQVTVAAGAEVLAESAGVLKAALDAVPAGGLRRRADRAQRMQAYLAFQWAAHEASVWPGWFGVLEQIVRGKEASSAQILPDLAAARSATSALLAALSEVRLVGNPEVRSLAEEIVTLLVDLMEARLPGTPPDGLRFRAAKRIYAALDRRGGFKAAEERFPRLTARFDDSVKPLLDKGVRKAKAERFNDCQLALGTWHKKFTCATQKDLGYGPRKWQIGKKPRTRSWQIWRSSTDWPGGWPPPDAADLIEQARRERSSRQITRENGKDPETLGRAGAI